ncbi:MAG TPA: low molecular weight protein arginine phosphatase [candidate division Zixibacteria bacterium]|nr:low molecular weight protein arginine phosphatase [candidate division Zixibacteria bacterium]
MPSNCKNILFVCSGNSCRSPMAEGIARSIALCEGYSMDFRSAGTLGIEDAPATPEAILAAKEHGADISRHRSQALNQDNVCWADVIIGMEYAHLESVKLFDIRGKKLMLLCSEEIEDPIGEDIGFYRAVARQIAECLDKLLSKLENEA